MQMHAQENTALTLLDFKEAFWIYSSSCKMNKTSISGYLTKLCIVFYAE
jgi:hypothetical protein